MEGDTARIFKLERDQKQNLDKLSHLNRETESVKKQIELIKKEFFSYFCYIIVLLIIIISFSVGFIATS